MQRSNSHITIAKKAERSALDPKKHVKGNQSARAGKVKGSAELLIQSKPDNPMDLLQTGLSQSKQNMLAKMTRSTKAYELFVDPLIKRKQINNDYGAQVRFQNAANASPKRNNIAPQFMSTKPNLAAFQMQSKQTPKLFLKSTKSQQSAKLYDHEIVHGEERLIKDKGMGPEHGAPQFKTDSSVLLKYVIEFARLVSVTEALQKSQQLAQPNDPLKYQRIESVYTENITNQDLAHKIHQRFGDLSAGGVVQDRDFT